MKKGKKINISIWVGLSILVLVVIITSIILHFKRQELKEIKDKNEIVTPDSNITMQENKIFLKNFEIFIDNGNIF